MFENFQALVPNRAALSDENIETFFWLVVDREPKKTVEAFKLLLEYRENVAEKVGQMVLEACQEVSVRS
jgi:hypothetical protein